MLLIRPINKSSRCKVLEKTTWCSYVEYRHQLFSPRISTPYLFFTPSFCLGFLVKLAHFKSCRIDSAADWKLLFICLLELCRHLSWAPLQNLALFTLNIWPLHAPCNMLKKMCERKEEEENNSWREREKKGATLTQYCTSVKYPTSC